MMYDGDDVLGYEEDIKCVHESFKVVVLPLLKDFS